MGKKKKKKRKVGKRKIRDKAHETKGVIKPTEIVNETHFQESPSQALPYMMDEDLI